MTLNAPLKRIARKGKKLVTSLRRFDYYEVEIEVDIPVNGMENSLYNSKTFSSRQRTAKLRIDNLEKKIEVWTAIEAANGVVGKVRRFLKEPYSWKKLAPSFEKLVENQLSDRKPVIKLTMHYTQLMGKRMPS